MQQSSFLCGARFLLCWEDPTLLFDVLIPAHAESQRQLETLIMSILFQKTPGWQLGRLLLCSDNPLIAETFMDRTSIEFIPQDPGLGKPDALNRMLYASDAPFCIQNSADCIPASEKTYLFLLAHMTNPVVGAVTCQPVPYESGFMFLPNLVWSSHHFVQPKLSAELFSFRRSLIDRLPPGIIHDDAYIHNVILQKSYQVVYEPRAIVFNSPPKTMREFYQQRKKNVIGNLQLPRDFNQNPPRMLRMRSLILIGLELLANVHGRLDYARGKIPKGLIGYNLESTKEVIR
jgi:cellulose synthase/poly-beta-1,6-N-acetylglucosamine synthase-like glycosyltransferase